MAVRPPVRAKSTITSQLRACHTKCLMVPTILTRLRKVSKGHSPKLFGFGLRKVRWRRRIRRDLSALYLVHIDVIGFQSDSQRLVQGDARGAVSNRGRYGGGLGGDQVALLQRDIVRRGGAQPEALFFSFEKLLLERTVPDGSFVAGAGLLQSHHAASHIHFHLVEILAIAELGLAE